MKNYIKIKIIERYCTGDLNNEEEKKRKKKRIYEKKALFRKSIKNNLISYSTNDRFLFE